MKQQVSKRWRNEERCLYSFRSTDNKKAARVLIHAEQHGHGCLFGMYLPKYVHISGMCWSGNTDKPDIEDLLVVLKEIKKDYHCNSWRLDETTI